MSGKGGNWDYDAMGAFTGRLEALMGGAPSQTRASLDRRGPPISPERSSDLGVPTDPPVRIDPEVAKVLAGTRHVAEVGQPPKPEKPKADGEGTWNRAWHNLARAGRVIGVAVLIAATVGPTLYAPNGFDRATTSVSQSIGQVTGSYNPHNAVGYVPHESLVDLWKEGFDRIVNGDKAPVVHQFEGKVLSHAAGYQDLAAHVQAGGKVDVTQWDGNYGSGFEAMYRDADGTMKRVQVDAGVKLPSGESAAYRLMTDLATVDHGQTAPAAASGGTADAPAAQTESRYQILYQTLADQGGFNMVTKNGTLIQVQPDNGDLNVSFTQSTGKMSRLTINEGNFAKYQDQVADLLQQRQMQGMGHFNPTTPGM